MNADGSGDTALTTDGHSHTPSWSPDGKQILFVHDAALREPRQGPPSTHHPVELQVMDADGKNRRLLLRTEAPIYSARWSPDGKAIAVSAALQQRSESGEEMRGGLYLIPASGGTPKLLYANGWSAAWSPDGKRLAFTVERPRGEWSIYVGNADGSDAVPMQDLPRYAGLPAWSPDGEWLAFASDRQVFVSRPDGTERREVAPPSGWSCQRIAWSGEGDGLVLGCYSSSKPCGFLGNVSSTGTVLPDCERRLFGIATVAGVREVRQLGEHDATAPAVSLRE